jgi:hypothetical protein
MARKISENPAILAFLKGVAPCESMNCEQCPYVGTPKHVVCARSAIFITAQVGGRTSAPALIAFLSIMPFWRPAGYEAEIVLRHRRLAFSKLYGLIEHIYVAVSRDQSPSHRCDHHHGRGSFHRKEIWSW